MSELKRSSCRIRNSSSSKSQTSVRSATKVASDINPVSKSSFYLYYYHLCKRENIPVYAALKPNRVRNDRVLDLVADRIRVEEWNTILTALKADTSLHAISIHTKMGSQALLEEIDTEEKVKRIKKWLSSICTNYILKSLLCAIELCVINTRILSTLELEGLQLNEKNVTGLVAALGENKSLRTLSFKGCPLGDACCEMICSVLKSSPNIEVIDLSDCNLSKESAKSIAKLIKNQQIYRYTESWHNSLRYNEPELKEMPGLRRITLNNNPRIGDAGVELILLELEDDLWLKALDMQGCNITEHMTQKIVDVVSYNRSLEIVDFRGNELTPTTISRIFEVLRNKRKDSCDRTEYKWCYSTTSVAAEQPGLQCSRSNVNNQALKVRTSQVVLRKNITNEPKINENRTIRLQRMKRENSAKAAKPQEITKVRRQYLAKESYMQRLLRQETTKRIKAEQEVAMYKKRITELLAERNTHIYVNELNNITNYIKKFSKIVYCSPEYEELAPIAYDMQKTLTEINGLRKSLQLQSATKDETLAIREPKGKQINIDAFTVNNYYDDNEDDYLSDDDSVNNLKELVIEVKVDTSEESFTEKDKD